MESKFREFCTDEANRRWARGARVLFATAELFVNHRNDVLRAGFLNLRLDGTLSIVNRPHYWLPPIA